MITTKLTTTQTTAKSTTTTVKISTVTPCEDTMVGAEPEVKDTIENCGKSMEDNIGGVTVVLTGAGEVSGLSVKTSAFGSDPMGC